MGMYLVSRVLGWVLGGDRYMVYRAGSWGHVVVEVGVGGAG
jgi:hypothetical protein